MLCKYDLSGKVTFKMVQLHGMDSLEATEMQIGIYVATRRQYHKTILINLFERFYK